MKEWNERMKGWKKGKDERREKIKSIMLTQIKP